MLDLNVEDEYKLARRLARTFSDLILRLRAQAKDSGLSPDVIADRLDWSLDDVAEISLGGDPTLSMLQDYARTVGADITFSCVPFAMRLYVDSDEQSAKVIDLPVHARELAEWTAPGSSAACGE